MIGYEDLIWSGDQLRSGKVAPGDGEQLDTNGTGEKVFHHVRNITQVFDVMPMWGMEHPVRRRGLMRIVSGLIECRIEVQYYHDKTEYRISKSIRGRSTGAGTSSRT
jgi:hypothetical protein